MEISEQQAAAALLRWYADMGVDEVVGPTPLGLYAWERSPAPGLQPKAPAEASVTQTPPKTQTFSPAQAAPAADEAIEAAKSITAACASFEELQAAVHDFDGCPLKAGAKHTVFADGAPGAQLLVIGEAPGRDEDQIGKPFVGRAGQLLDRMLAAIGRSRDKDTLITNVVYWRPPGNRTPTQIETAICRPFVDRLIDLTDPQAVMLTGGAPMQALLGVSGIMRARGIWREIETASGKRYAAMPMFHPAFLLRQPANKRLAWSDLLALNTRLTEG
jgi:uracil-DNA glycosylase